MPCISSLLSFARHLLADRLFCLLILNLYVAFFTYNSIEKCRHIKKEGWQLKLAYPKVFSKDVSFLNVFFWTLYTRVTHFHQMRIPIMFTFHIYFYLDIFLFFIILFFSFWQTNSVVHVFHLASSPHRKTLFRTNECLANRLNSFDLPLYETSIFFRF